MNTAEGINQRIELLIQELSAGNQKEFSKEIGVPPTTINGIVGPGQSEPKFKLLSKICLRFPQVNARWLLTGEGEMWGK